MFDTFNKEILAHSLDFPKSPLVQHDQQVQTRPSGLRSIEPTSEKEREREKINPNPLQREERKNENERQAKTYLNRKRQRRRR